MMPQGEFARHTEDPRLYRTCMFTTYFTEHIPAIMREVNSRYDVDGIFTNGWPPLGKTARLSLRSTAKSFHRPRVDRLLGSRSMLASSSFGTYTMRIAKEKKPDNLYFGNLGGSLRCTANLKHLAKGRTGSTVTTRDAGGDDTPIWGCTLQGRVCSSGDERQNQHQRDSGVVNWFAALAERFQKSARSADVDG